MKPTLKRVALLAAVGTMAVAGPVAGASAATPPDLAAAFPLAAAGFPVTGFPGAAAGWSGFLATPVGYVGPGVAGPAVIGPAVITTAPSSFINTNIQVSAGGNLSGGQVG